MKSQLKSSTLARVTRFVSAGGYENW